MLELATGRFLRSDPAHLQPVSGERDARKDELQLGKSQTPANRAELATTPIGGARRGPGRPRTTLLKLVRSGSFTASNWRHRALLESEDLPIDDPTIPNLLELRRLQDGYRVKKRCGVGASALWIARSFTAHLREEVKG